MADSRPEDPGDTGSVAVEPDRDCDLARDAAKTGKVIAQIVRENDGPIVKECDWNPVALHVPTLLKVVS